MKFIFGAAAAALCLIAVARADDAPAYQCKAKLNSTEQEFTLKMSMDPTSITMTDAGNPGYMILAAYVDLGIAKIATMAIAENKTDEPLASTTVEGDAHQISLSYGKALSVHCVK